MPLELEDALASQQAIEKTKKVSTEEIPIVDVGRLVQGLGQAMLAEWLDKAKDEGRKVIDAQARAAVG